MSHLLNLRTASAGFLFACIFANPQYFSARDLTDTSFSIDNDNYYLHPVSFHDLSATLPDKYDWNQNILADSKYIYLADHTDNSKEQLVIKRFNAIDGTPAQNLIIDGEEMIDWGLADLEDEQLYFYLADCNDDNYFVLLPNPPYDGISKKTPCFSFYLIDKSGHIEKEFYINNVKDISSFTNSISYFGIPDFKGSLINGNFEMFLPMLDELGHMWIVDFVFEKSSLIRNSSVFYSNDNFSKPSVKIIDDNFMLIDDDRIHPSLYSYTSNTNHCYDALYANHINAHGCNWFYFDNHRLISSGDILFDSDGGFEKTQFNIGLWDNNTASATPAVLQSEPAIDFSSYRPLGSIQFGKSTHDPALPSYYTYRQFMAISDYGDNVKHLHFYVPGEFLSTYQLNKHDVPTGIEDIVSASGLQELNVSIHGRQLFFNRPVSGISVFDNMGIQIYNSTHPVKTIDMSKFNKGIYLIKSAEKSFKILL